jgi:CO dehydrogenase/acetyl-CoA synthase beta subunit
MKIPSLRMYVAQIMEYQVEELLEGMLERRKFDPTIYIVNFLSHFIELWIRDDKTVQSALFRLVLSLTCLKRGEVGRDN